MPFPFAVAVLAAFPSKPPDYSALSRRIANQQSQVSTVQCLLLDTMVPRQRIEVSFGPPVSELLEIIRNTGGTLGVLGMDHRDGHVLRCGVEARIESASSYRAGNGFFSSHALSPFDAPNARGYQALDTALVGGRRFELVNDAGSSKDAWPPDKPIFQARVRWLDEETGTAAAILKGQALPPLVREWTQLVRSGQRERTAGQLDALLSDLGPIPAVEETDDLAFWTAALINPLPALGVSLEVRSAVLEASSALQRVEIVHRALTDSIERLRSMPPGPFECEPPPNGP